MFRIKDKDGFALSYEDNEEILKFIDGRNFEFDSSKPQHIKLDGCEFYIQDHVPNARVWFTELEFEEYCEEVTSDNLTPWLLKKAGFQSRSEALQEFNKPKLLQIKQLEEQIEKLKSQLAR